MKKLIFIALWACGPLLLFGQNPTDACGAGVASLTSNGSCSTTSFTLPGSYANGGQAIASCQAGLDRDDGWYQFTATGTSTTIEVSGDQDVTLAVYTGSCGTGELGCDQQNSGVTATVTVATTVGLTYYVQIHRNSGNNTADMNGTICVHTGGAPPPPPTATVQPTACATATYTLLTNQTANFYDDGGPGGDPCLDQVGGGNYCNCNCFTTTTVCAAAGQYLIVSFSEFAMWNTTSGWDWMRIYDNSTTSGTVLYDNSSTGPDNPRGDCGINSPAGPALEFCSTGQCLTFQFWATSVVNRAGWEGLLQSVPTPCTPLLAVEYEHFTGSLIEDKVRLEWETAFEVENDHFTVLRSTDGLVWDGIAEVPGMGDSQDKQNYRIWDESPLHGKSFYRLMATDLDGKTSYSPAVEIHYAPEAGIQVYPNPTVSAFTLELAEESVQEGKYLLEITDIRGRTQTLQLSASAGQTRFEIAEFKDYAPGVYMIKVFDPAGKVIGSRRLVRSE